MIFRQIHSGTLIFWILEFLGFCRNGSNSTEKKSSEGKAD